MKKFLFLLLALLLFTGVVHAKLTYFDLKPDAVLPPGTKGLMFAIGGDDWLYISHEDGDKYYYDRGKAMPGTLPPDSSTVVITGEGDNVVLKKECNTSHVWIPLNFEGILSGKYTLSVFWNKCWWRGDFEFKSHWPEGQAVYIDSTYYLLNKGYASTVWPEYYLENRRTVTHRMDWMIFERDYPLHVVIPSELTYEGETYQVTGIGQRSFKGCYYMQSISLPNTITYIDHGAFMACKNLDHVNIPESVTRIERGAFAECDKLSFMVLPEGIETLANNMFKECTNLSTVTLPGSLTSIEEWAFALCTSLPYIDIPDNVASIGEAAFQACENLMEIKLPKKLARIEKYTFRGCKLLKAIEIPERVRSIGTEAFAGCTSLTSVTLPEGMTSIDELAFTDLPNTAHIYCKAQKPFKIAARSFNYNCTLHVPQGCKEAYEEDDSWKNFTTIVEDEDTKDNEAYIFAGDMTGVKPAVEAESAERFYDLQGRPVDGTQKGILIRNGKKVLVK